MSDTLFLVRLKHHNPPIMQTIYPETVTYLNEPKGEGKGDAIPTLRPWRDLMADGDYQPYQSYEWLMKTGNMWVNASMPESGDIKHERISCGGNVNAIDQVISHYGRVRSFSHDEIPPYPVGWFAFEQNPEYTQKVTVLRPQD